MPVTPRTGFSLLALLLSFTRPLLGQTACVPDTTWRKDTLYYGLAIERWPTTPRGRALAAEVASILREHYVIDAPIVIPEPAPRGAWTDSTGSFTHAGLLRPMRLRFQLDPEGHPLSVQLSTTRGASAVYRALIHAIWAADSDGTLPKAGPQDAPVDRVLSYALLTADSIPPWWTVALGRVVGDVQPVRVADRIQVLVQPLQQEGVRGLQDRDYVTLRLLVDRAGRVMRSSIALARTSNPSLAEYVVASAPTWRFPPARLAGCPTDDLVNVVARYSATAGQLIINRY